MPFQSRRAWLVIEDEPRRILERIARSRSESAQRVERARILLAYAVGHTVSAIARDDRPGPGHGLPPAAPRGPDGAWPRTVPTARTCATSATGKRGLSGDGTDRLLPRLFGHARALGGPGHGHGRTEASTASGGSSMPLTSRPESASGASTRFRVRESSATALGPETRGRLAGPRSGSPPATTPN